MKWSPQHAHWDAAFAEEVTVMDVGRPLPMRRGSAVDERAESVRRAGAELQEAIAAAYETITGSAP